ncbi:hypothetical protein PR048_019135 [Dryococelus australis]|uniref:Uncharacterized protein n=1 Tax=Dryococelus australis TaxID=614101 RepID=A0ABQ9H2R7_9NEOP|nr:hypothetical protein PR048_019135 [Dryococelus australis]
MRVIEVCMEQCREKGGGNGRSPRKPVDQRYRLARFPHAKIRSDPGGDRTWIAFSVRFGWRLTAVFSADKTEVKWQRSSDGIQWWRKVRELEKTHRPMITTATFTACKNLGQRKHFNWNSLLHYRSVLTSICKNARFLFLLCATLSVLIHSGQHTYAAGLSFAEVVFALQDIADESIFTGAAPVKLGSAVLLAVDLGRTFPINSRSYKIPFRRSDCRKGGSKMQELNPAVQPFVIVQGPAVEDIQAVYVSVDKLLYKVPVHVEADRSFWRKCRKLCDNRKIGAWCYIEVTTTSIVMHKKKFKICSMAIAGNTELIGALVGAHYLQERNERRRRNIVVRWLLGRAARQQSFSRANVTADIPVVNVVDHFEECAALFVAKMYSNPALMRNIVQQVIDEVDIESLFGMGMSYLKSKLDELLSGQHDTARVSLLRPMRCRLQLYLTNYDLDQYEGLRISYPHMKSLAIEFRSVHYRPKITHTCVMYKVVYTGFMPCPLFISFIVLNVLSRNVHVLHQPVPSRRVAWRRKLRVESVLFVPVTRSQREYGDFPYFVFTDLTPYFRHYELAFLLCTYARVRRTHRTHSIPENPESQQCGDWETPLAPSSISNLCLRSSHVSRRQEFLHIIASRKGKSFEFCAACSCDFSIAHAGRNDVFKHSQSKKLLDNVKSIESNKKLSFICDTGDNRLSRAEGADKAPVMVGLKSVVASVLKREIPNLIAIGCPCHLVNLAAGIAAAFLAVKVDEMLVDIFYYLEESEMRKEKVKEFQKLHDTDTKIIIKHVTYPRAGCHWSYHIPKLKVTQSGFPNSESGVGVHETGHGVKTNDKPTSSKKPQLEIVVSNLKKSKANDVKKINSDEKNTKKPVRKCLKEFLSREERIFYVSVL